MSAGRADVVVVGLGPAGARAAAAAAEAGARVIALDRRQAAGLPVQCAEFVPALIGIEAQAMAAAVRQRIVAMATYVEDDAADLTAPFPGHMLDRARFDAALVERARAAGAQCRFGASVRRIDASGVTLADGSRIVSPVVVGADGPRSRVGRAIGQANRELVETRQVSVALHVPHDATDIFLSPAIPGGYAWLFPKAGIANLGAGIDPAHRHALKRIVDGLHDRLVAQGRVGREVLARTGGAIPVGGMRVPCGRLGPLHALLAGDAAGLANPVTGAGIAAAVYSGGLAGAAAAALAGGDATAGDAYAEELEAVLGASLERALTRRRERATALRDAPRKAALRRGWIAYPDYWAASEEIAA